MAIRVLLVGRHEGLLEGLRAQLSCDGEFVIHAHAVGIAQAEACFRANEIDVVIVDGDCSLDAVLIYARMARQVRPSCGLLLIESTQVEPWRDADLTDLLQGLIGRQDLPQCLPEAVRIVGANKVYLSPEVRGRATCTDNGFRYSPPQTPPPESMQPEAFVAATGTEHAPAMRQPPNPIESRRGFTRDGAAPPERYNRGATTSQGRPPISENGLASREGFRARAARRAGAFQSPRQMPDVQSGLL